MKNPAIVWTAFVVLAAVNAATAATATFTPVGPASVERGQVVTFEVVVASSTLGAFNTADIVIGSDLAKNIGFSYSGAWTSAFANVTTPAFDNGFYAQDVFVGGNNPTSVGSSLLLGMVTIDTTGMPYGNHSVLINHTLDGVSTLGLSGTPEALNGLGAFTVTPPVPTISDWGAVTLALTILIAGTMILRSRKLLYSTNGSI